MITEQGQFSDRFIQALNQFGSDTMAVRVGGIYILERIARDSPIDRPVVAEILAAHVRGRAAWPTDAPSPPPDIGELPGLSTRAPDVQEAITVLARLPVDQYRDLQLRLNQVDLRKADLPYALLMQADLREAHLEGANLEGANLAGANLKGANLEGANLKGADLDMVHLTEANLAKAFYDDSTRWPEGFDAQQLRETAQGPPMDSPT